MLTKLNSPVLYLICGGIIFFVALVCVVFLVRAYRAGIAVGMDRTKMKRAITSSATFAVLPSVGILLGVLALSGSLGTPWPWLRLSVIGALHYETSVADAASQAVGIGHLSGASMTPKAFSTIALLMSVCIMWGMVLATFFTKKYAKKLGGGDTGTKSNWAGFGDLAMTAMFIGLISAYLGSYLGDFVSRRGLFTFSGSWLPLAVAFVSALSMAGFLWLKEKKQADWVDNFSIAGSMLLGMVAAVFLNKI
ncbi:MAG: DUF5058 family protein [Clostridia bacterium]|nr:DUF5058 family protein [Clostridia bacterium]